MPTFTYYTFSSNMQWCRGSQKKTEEKVDEEEETQDNSTPGKTEEPCITFSTKATLVNITMSIIVCVVHGLSMTSIAEWDKNWGGIPYYLQNYNHLYFNMFNNPVVYFPFFLVPILNLLFTLLSLPLISRNPRFLSLAKYILANLVFNTAAYVVFVPCLVQEWKPENLQVFFLPIPIISLLLTLLLVLLNRYCNVSLPNCCNNFFNLPKVEHGALVPSDPLSHYILDADGKPELVPEIEEVELEEIRSKEPVGMTNKSYNEEPEGAFDKTATKL